MRRNDFISKAAIFMNCVAEIETDIRRNPRGFFPPGYMDGLWDEDFASTFEDLTPFLKPILKERMHFPSTKLRYAYKPFTATSAIEALMFFLNPKEKLHGEAGVLDSEEYVTLKAEAINEIQLLLARLKPKNSLPPTIVEVCSLRSLLMDHHYKHPGNINTRTLSSKEIERSMNWSQAKVSRRMASLFKTKIGGGFKRYHAIFSTANPPEGFRQRFDDGDFGVDGLWIDRPRSDE